MNAPQTLTLPGLEAVYDALALAIDEAGPDKAELFLVKLQEATTLLSQAGETLSTRLEAHQTRVEGTFSSAVDKLTSETRDAILVPTRQLNEYFASLSKGVESLNGTLQKLGGETIVVQKRGFFSK